MLVRIYCYAVDTCLVVEAPNVEMVDQALADYAEAITECGVDDPDRPYMWEYLQNAGCYQVDFPTVVTAEH